MEKGLLVTNLTAREVSESLRNVIVKALSADIELEVADTTHQDHATELAKDAADRGLDVVISFGGDGTMNEVVNGIAESETALAILPGGMANVLCRVLGIPEDIVEATGHLINRLKAGRTKKIHLGRAGNRYFTFCCGIGLDASTVRRVHEHPRLKAKMRDWYFLYCAFATFFGEYSGREPYIELKTEAGSECIGHSVISRTAELTYFKKWPVVVSPEASLDGALDVFAATKITTTWIPGLVAGLLKTRRHVKHPNARYFKEVTRATLNSKDGPFPVQVDGEFLGERTHLDVELIPNALSVLD